MLHKLNTTCPEVMDTGNTSCMETIKVSVLVLHHTGTAVEIMSCTHISFVLSIQKDSELSAFFWHEAIRCLEDSF